MKYPALLLISIILFSAFSSASAMNQYGYQTPQAGYEMPGDKLREGIDKVTNYLAKSKNRKPEEMFAFIEKEISPYFDFAQMSKWIAGRNYKYMDPAKRATFEKTVKEMFLAAMARQIAQFGYERVQYMRPRGNPRSNQVTLSLIAYSKQSKPTRVSFRMYRGQDGWKVFDVSSNGQSAVNFYRQYFASKLRQQQPPAQYQRPGQGYRPGAYQYPGYQYR